jgi:hypothetical protein
MTITKVKFANEQGLETGWIYIERPDLTDEEIMEVYKEVSEPFGEKRLYEIHDFARAILRKAQDERK